MNDLDIIAFLDFHPNKPLVIEDVLGTIKDVEGVASTITKIRRDLNDTITFAERASLTSAFMRIVARLFECDNPPTFYRMQTRFALLAHPKNEAEV